MGFVIKKETKKETLSKDELFEKFMIEIGQYKKTDSGIEITGEYIKTSELSERFKDWMKKRV